MTDGAGIPQELPDGLPEADTRAESAGDGSSDERPGAR
jgi:hypothetical protein